MHCELLVPGLFAEIASLRLPALELLLARGRESPAEPASAERWLLGAFGLGEEPLAAGALTVLADGGDPRDERWARADPVHLRLLRDRVVLVPSAAFTVSREEAEALCEALNRHFGDALALYPLHPERWCARLAEDVDPQDASPLEAAGRDVGARRPSGAGATRWHALLNEAQMLLHAHPVNEAREARGEPPVNSVWLWGAGRAPHGARGRWQSVSSDEPIALGLARLANASHRALAASADEWLGRAPEDGAHLVVLDALSAPLALGDGDAYRERLRLLEARWFAPLLAALRAGRVGMVTVHVPDGSAAASFETVRADLRRFWRRPRSLERYA